MARSRSLRPWRCWSAQRLKAATQGYARVAAPQVPSGAQLAPHDIASPIGHRERALRPNELRISCEGAARQPPRRPRSESTAWRLPPQARPRQLHALVRRPHPMVGTPYCCRRLACSCSRHRSAQRSERNSRSTEPSGARARSVVSVIQAEAMNLEDGTEFGPVGRVTNFCVTGGEEIPAGH